MRTFNLSGECYFFAVMNKTLFVLGAPRSGTTLLINFLVMNQPKIFGTVWESQFYTTIYRRPFQLMTYIKDQYFTHLFNPEEIKELFSKSSSHPEFFRNAIKLKLQQSNKNVFVEKSPMHTLFHKEILRDFENAEFILINRNPFSNIQSIAFTKWIPMPKMLPVRLKTSKTIRYFFATYLFYKYWKVSKKVSKHPKCKLTISYEDIILENVNVKQELENALGFNLNELYVPRPYSDAVSHKNRVLDKSRVDDYKNVMPQYVQRYIKAIFMPENFGNKIIRIPFLIIFEFLLFATRLIRKK